ncbi:MAG: DUF3187 family protein [Planctomycetes bacterium]|nr:DUF3187 family protein [Planctomycetota bacterium]
MKLSPLFTILLRLTFSGNVVFGGDKSTAATPKFWARAEENPGKEAAEEPGVLPDLARNLTGRGLLSFQDPFPLSVLHLENPVDTLLVLKEGDGRFDANIGLANSFVLEKNVVVDAETYRLTLGGWYALRNDFYIGADLPIHTRGGGVLDGLVIGFHDLFGLSQGGRTSRPRNDFDVTVTEKDGRKVKLSSGVGLGDLTLKAHWNINSGDAFLPTVAVDALGGLPTSTPGFGTDGLDLGLALSLYKTVLKRVHLYTVLGITYLTDPTTEGFSYAKVGNQGVAGIEVAVTKDFSLIFQGMTFSKLLNSPFPLDQVRNYLAGGFKWEVERHCEIELSLIENLLPFNSSADIAFNIALTFRL